MRKPGHDRVVSGEWSSPEGRWAQGTGRRRPRRAKFPSGKASALSLPFGPASFDGAYLLQVGRNIAVKSRLFAEVRRVLRPGGVSEIHDILRIGEGDLKFSVPWASHPGMSPAGGSCRRGRRLRIAPSSGNVLELQSTAAEAPSLSPSGRVEAPALQAEPSGGPRGQTAG